MSVHAMKSHTYRINRGVHGASWRKVVQKQRPAGNVKLPEFEMDFCYLLQDPRHQPGDQAWTTTLVMVDVAAPDSDVCSTVNKVGWRMRKEF